MENDPDLAKTSSIEENKNIIGKSWLSLYHYIKENTRHRKLLFSQIPQCYTVCTFVWLLSHTLPLVAFYDGTEDLRRARPLQFDIIMEDSWCCVLYYI